MTDFTMPSLGADMDEGTILEWLVKPGDVVSRGDPMAVVDTDKAAIEIESFDDGVVDAVLVQPGERVAVGTPIATISLEAAAPAARSPKPAKAKAPPSADVSQRRLDAVSPPLRHRAAELGVDLAKVWGTGRGGRVTRDDVESAARAATSGPVAGKPESGVREQEAKGRQARGRKAARPAERARISPFARRLAAELGVDATTVAGTGAQGAVLADDIRAAAGRATPETPTPKPPAAPARAQPVGKKPASRATIAALMSRSKREIPHYYVATTVDMTAVTTWLRQTNGERVVADRIVPAAAILRATALAARQMPVMNGFWIDDGFVPGDAVHLGVAVTVRGGSLVAPALHDACDLDLQTLMHRLRDLVGRARRGRLTRAELADPTLTVTDLGEQGVEEVMGVIQPPQVALIGVGKIVDRPWAVDGLLGVRPLARITLSADHRASDGNTGARFLATIDELLQNPEGL